MKTGTSKDGTTIAYDQVGTGFPLILVTGALGVRSGSMQDGFVNLLMDHFTVINYDRRGRGDSTDTKPYAPEREIEDIEALIDAAGGEAYLYGVSSGAILALEAAAQFPNKVKKLAMYEPPFIIDGSRPPLPVDYVEQLDKATAENRRGDAVNIFMMQALLIPQEFVDMMRNAPPPEGMYADDVKPPAWSDMETVAHTLAYDGRIVREYLAGHPLPAGRWNAFTGEGLVLVGGSSEPFFHDGAKVLAANVPNIRYQVLEGQDHAVSPSALAPALVAFLS
ncbi:MAG: alpha/beta hydrolase [Chloroflexi bacterium]|nr:alpha/beta hydrolase [Chloroflexota bacterium]MCC6894888.1 alpha/beta hydrolase [Anaerolineae bacterium]